MISADRCSYPPHHHNSLIRTSVDREPSLTGTNITFSCPAGVVPTGPTSATCMENGKWEPDPQEADCEGHKTNSNFTIKFLLCTKSQLQLSVIVARVVLGTI